jgi:hypothetical protein
MLIIQNFRCKRILIMLSEKSFPFDQIRDFRFRADPNRGKVFLFNSNEVLISRLIFLGAEINCHRFYYVPIRNCFNLILWETVLFGGKGAFRLPVGIPTVWFKQVDIGDMMYAPCKGQSQHGSCEIDNLSLE